MTPILFMLIGLLSCQSDDLTAEADELEGEEISDSHEFGDKNYSAKPDDYWDTIVEPVDGDNRDHLRDIFAAKDNKKILIKKGTYPIEIVAKEEGTRPDHGDNLQIKNRKDVLIVFEEGSKIEVSPNEFGHREAKYMVMGIRDSKNVDIINPVIRGDKYTHKGNKKGEWAAGIRIIKNSKNINIKGADIRKMWGDGITVSQGKAKKSTYPENILIEDFNTIDNGRNGISVTVGKHITIKNGESSKNDRTLPKAGIDLERAGSYAPMEDFVIENVKLSENGGYSLVSKSGTGAAVFNNLDIRNGMVLRGNAKKQIVKNSIIRRSEKGHSRFFVYKTNSPVEFRNNKFFNNSLLIERAREDILIEGNEFIRENGKEGSPLITLTTNNDSKFNKGDITIKNNKFEQETEDYIKTGISLNESEGKIKLIDNQINFKDIKVGVRMRPDAQNIEAKKNTIEIGHKVDSRVKINGKKGTKYDFSGNEPVISKYSTENLKKSINIKID